MGDVVPRAAASPAIDVRDLSRRYGRTIAVDDLSLRVSSGRIFALLGPNGAGKSTTMACLAGLIEPSAGTISVLGAPMTVDSLELKRRIGIMPESLGLLDDLYPGEFLDFVARVFGLEPSLRSRRVDQLLETLGLADARGTRLGVFSAGMRKKVAFAAAVIHQPELLFLDEPFESMDPTTVAMLKGWLRELADRGGTVFMTSHVLERVERLCDEVAMMKDGRIVWRGEITALSRGGQLRAGDRAFASLEELFVHLIGRPARSLSWL